jgi:hypothetical protein
MFKRQTFYTIFFFIIFSFFKIARADRLYEFYRGVRAMGLGNAYTAIADDSDALFYNPAGLAHNKTVRFELLNPKLETSADNLTLYKNFTNGITADAINSTFGKHISLGGSVFPSVWLPNFALGYYYGLSTQIIALNQTFPEIQANYYFDKGIITGFGFETRGFKKFHYLRYGLNFKYLQRQSANETIPVVSVVSGSTTQFKNLRKGPATGYGVGLGLQYEISLSKDENFILGTSWNDIGDTSFGSQLSPTGVAPIRNNLSVGASYIRPFSKKNLDSRDSLSFNIEGRHLLERNIDPRLKMHFGSEFRYSLFRFDVGLNQATNISAGVGVDLFLLEISAATYGVENLSISGVDRERRYMLQITMALDLFDMNFKNPRTSDRKKYPRALK